MLRSHTDRAPGASEAAGAVCAAPSLPAPQHRLRRLPKRARALQQYSTVGIPRGGSSGDPLSLWPLPWTRPSIWGRSPIRPRGGAPHRPARCGCSAAAILRQPKRRPRRRRRLQPRSRRANRSRSRSRPRRRPHHRRRPHRLQQLRRSPPPPRHLIQRRPERPRRPRARLIARPGTRGRFGIRDGRRRRRNSRSCAP